MIEGIAGLNDPLAIPWFADKYTLRVIGVVLKYVSIRNLYILVN